MYIHARRHMTRTDALEKKAKVHTQNVNWVYGKRKKSIPARRAWPDGRQQRASRERFRQKTYFRPEDRKTRPRVRGQGPWTPRRPKSRRGTDRPTKGWRDGRRHRRTSLPCERSAVRRTAGVWAQLAAAVAVSWNGWAVGRRARRESAGRPSHGTDDGDGVCRREKCCRGVETKEVGRWEKSPSQPCPSVCGGKPPVSLTVCLRKRRWTVRRRPTRSKRPFCRPGHCFWTLFADVWDGETHSSVEARSIVRPFWRARGNDVTVDRGVGSFVRLCCTTGGSTLVFVRPQRHHADSTREVGKRPALQRPCTRSTVPSRHLRSVRGRRKPSPPPSRPTRRLTAAMSYDDLRFLPITDVPCPRSLCIMRITCALYVYNVQV